MGTIPRRNKINGRKTGICTKVKFDVEVREIGIIVFQLKGSLVTICGVMKESCN